MSVSGSNVSPLRPPFYAREFPSDFDAMMEALNGGISALREQGYIGDAQEPSTRLCLEEALVNAIRHGNECDGSRKVRIEMLEEGACCRIRVVDEGEGFCADSVKDPDADQLGGRGLCLIRHFMDQVEYHPKERCLEMRFCKAAVKEG